MTIKGLDELIRDMNEIAERSQDLRPILKTLESLARKHAHEDTGYLKSSIERGEGFVEAKAPYAGYEEERGGSHAFATIAIEEFQLDEWADWVVEPF